MLFAFVLSEQHLPLSPVGLIFALCINVFARLALSFSAGFQLGFMTFLKRGGMWQKKEAISQVTRANNIIVVMHGLLQTRGKRQQKQSNQDVLAPEDTLRAKTYWPPINGNQPQAGSLIEWNWIEGNPAWRRLLRRWLFPVWLTCTRQTWEEVCINSSFCSANHTHTHSCWYEQTGGGKNKLNRRKNLFTAQEPAASR